MLCFQYPATKRQEKIYNPECNYEFAACSLDVERAGVAQGRQGNDNVTHIDDDDDNDDDDERFTNYREI